MSQGGGFLTVLAISWAINAAEFFPSKLPSCVLEYNASIDGVRDRPHFYGEAGFCGAWI